MVALICSVRWTSSGSMLPPPMGPGFGYLWWVESA